MVMMQTEPSLQIWKIYHFRGEWSPSTIATKKLDEIKKQCLLLTRLHDTSTLLRSVDRVQKLAKCIGEQEMLQGSIMMREVGENFHQNISSAVGRYYLLKK